MQIRRFSKDHDFICFKHATMLAIAGCDITENMDDYDTEYFMGSVSCSVCNVKYSWSNPTQEQIDSAAMIGVRRE